MVAKLHSPKRDTAATLRRLSAEQDTLHRAGCQRTHSQADLARELGVSRSAVEQMEMAAKLRFLKRLARIDGQCLLDLGGTFEQLAFLRSMTITSTNIRRLWNRWRELQA